MKSAIIRRIKTEYILIAVILFTASFDIFGVVNVGGMTLRFSLLLISIELVCLLLRRERVALAPGIGWLLLWLALQFVAAFGSSDYKYSFGYFACL